MKTKMDWHEVADDFKERYPEEYKSFFIAMKRDLIFDAALWGIGCGILIGSLISDIVHKLK